MQKPSKVSSSELRDARHKFSTFRRADFSTNIKTSASQQAISKLLKSNLTKVGFQSDKFSALIKQGDAEARQRIAILKAEADMQSPAVLDTLNRTVENLSTRLEILTTLGLPDAPAQHVLLDTATEIFASSGITLDSSHIGPTPESNFAKFLWKASAGDAGFSTPFGETVSFGFLWQNPSDSQAVVSADGYIVLNGFCSVFSDGDFFGTGVSRLSVDVGLQISELWNDPPTQNALSLYCDSFGFLAAGNADGQSLFRGFDLLSSQFVVPPKGTVGFSVFCNFFAEMFNGQTENDFSFGGRQLLCPGVLLNVLT